MRALAVSAIGTDRPGIVARVTGVLADAGCNLEDTAMTILRGEFAMMLVVAAPDAESAEALETRLAPVAHDLDLRLTVRDLGASRDHDPMVASDDTWTVVVYGADRPGIVHRVATTLADRGVNILDLATRLTDDGVYSMVLEVSIPASSGIDSVRAALDDEARALGVEATLHRSDLDIL